MLQNFRVIMKYNPAEAYALAIGHLADRLRGGEPFVQAWPRHERVLSRAERLRAAAASGAPRLRRRRAGRPARRAGPAPRIRDFQAQVGQVPDGFASGGGAGATARAGKPAIPAHGYLQVDIFGVLLTGLAATVADGGLRWRDEQADFRMACGASALSRLVLARRLLASAAPVRCRPQRNSGDAVAAASSAAPHQQPQQPFGGCSARRQRHAQIAVVEASAPRSTIRARRRRARKPDATPTTTIVVMGDSMADWLAYGLEDAFADAPEIGIVRKHRTDSGLIRYDARSDLDWRRSRASCIAARTRPNSS